MAVCVIGESLTRHTCMYVHIYSALYACHCPAAHAVWRYMYVHVRMYVYTCTCMYVHAHCMLATMQQHVQYGDICMCMYEGA